MRSKARDPQRLLVAHSPRAGSPTSATAAGKATPDGRNIPFERADSSVALEAFDSSARGGGAERDSQWSPTANQ